MKNRNAAIKNIAVCLFAIGGLIVFEYCSPSKKHKQSTRKITYIDDIKPIIVSNCSPCHTGGRNSDLHIYTECKDLIDESLLRIKMQPSERGFMPERRNKLPDSLIHILDQWKADGLLEKIDH
jgi:hypothetical protein